MQQLNIFKTSHICYFVLLTNLVMGIS